MSINTGDMRFTWFDSQMGNHLPTVNCKYLYYTLADAGHALHPFQQDGSHSVIRFFSKSNKLNSVHAHALPHRCIRAVHAKCEIIDVIILSNET